MALQQAGVMTWASGAAAAALGSLHLPPAGLFAALHLVFFALHYLFASQTAHVAALYPVFCSLLLATGGCPGGTGQPLFPRPSDNPLLPTSLCIQLVLVIPSSG
jgi:di/tricarboxylate transporter